MTSTNKMIFGVALVLASSTGLVKSAKAQQQWGPPAQSKYYHNPGNPPTYTAYNTETPRVAPQPAAAPAARPAAARTRVAPRRVVHVSATR